MGQAVFKKYNLCVVISGAKLAMRELGGNTARSSYYNRELIKTMKYYITCNFNFKTIVGYKLQALIYIKFSSYFC